MHVKLYVDGGNHGKNPSPQGVYWSVAREHEDGRIEPLTERRTSDRYFTNNEAEYLAVIEALGHLMLMPGVTKATLHSDSQLIVQQFNGRWKIGEERLQQLCKLAHEIAELLVRDRSIDLELLWVRRAENVKRLGH